MLFKAHGLRVNGIMSLTEKKLELSNAGSASV